MDRVLAVSFALCVLAAPALRAASVDLQRLVRVADAPVHGDPFTASLAPSGAERQLFDDASDGHFDEFSLVEVGLVAGGVTDAAAQARYRGVFQQLADAVRSASGGYSDAEKLELTHRLLHRVLLRGGYDANATDLAHTLDTGIYNCASATLLYVALAQELGLEAAAVELPGHVRACIFCTAGECEVEVTCLNWSEAVAFGGIKSSAGGNRRLVTHTGLVAMIYYNRGVDAFHERRFADAVAANRRALLLDPANTAARGNLLATVNNWSLALCEAGRFDEAERLLTAGRRYEPNHVPFIHNASHVARTRARSATHNPLPLPPGEGRGEGADDLPPLISVPQRAAAFPTPFAQ